MYGVTCSCAVRCWYAMACVHACMAHIYKHAHVCHGIPARHDTRIQACTRCLVCRGVRACLYACRGVWRSLLATLPRTEAASVFQHHSNFAQDRGKREGHKRAGTACMAKASQAASSE
jgi:hypothetical protein